MAPQSGAIFMTKRSSLVLNPGKRGYEGRSGRSCSLNPVEKLQRLVPLKKLWRCKWRYSEAEEEGPLFLILPKNCDDHFPLEGYDAPQMGYFLIINKTLGESGYSAINASANI